MTHYPALNELSMRQLRNMTLAQNAVEQVGTYVQTQGLDSECELAQRQGRNSETDKLSFRVSPNQLFGKVRSSGVLTRIRWMMKQPLNCQILGLFGEQPTNLFYFYPFISHMLFCYLFLIEMSAMELFQISAPAACASSHLSRGLSGDLRNCKSAHGSYRSKRLGRPCPSN